MPCGGDWYAGRYLDESGHVVVRVTVVSPTDEQLALLRRFDPLDGAVQIVYGSGAVNNAVARVEPIYESAGPVGAGD